MYHLWFFFEISTLFFSTEICIYFGAFIAAVFRVWKGRTEKVKWLGIESNQRYKRPLLQKSRSSPKVVLLDQRLPFGFIGDFFSQKPVEAIDSDLRWLMLRNQSEEVDYLIRVWDLSVSFNDHGKTLIISQQVLDQIRYEMKNFANYTKIRAGQRFQFDPQSVC